jgi:hypothetical protein
MQSGTKTTSWAVLLGASLGAVLAVVGPGPSDDASAARPFTPVASISQFRAAPSTRPVAPTLVDAPAPVIEVADGAIAGQPLAATETDEAALSLDCARGDPVACLERAELADRAGDADGAQLHRRLAVQKLVERCAERNGGACARLAELYRSGSGVEQNTATSEALAQRAQQLCRQRPTSGCPAPAQTRVP